MQMNEYVPEVPNIFNPKFCDIRTGEYFCFLQYIHYTIRYLPRFIRIDVAIRC